MQRRSHPILTIGIAFLTLGFVARAQEKKEESSETRTLRHEITALKEGQKRIENELAQIKELLRDKLGPPNRATNSGPTSISLNVEGEPFRGSPGARVAVMEYSSFECPYCAKYVREVYPEIDRDFIQTGKIKYFFRDLPEPGETNAWIKAQAARCAGDQGKFWEMHDSLFSNQNHLQEKPLLVQAHDLGIKIDDFNACLSGERYLEGVRLSVEGARRMRLRGTPSFLIGTLNEAGDLMTTANILVGAESAGPIRSALEELLKTEESK